MSRGCLSLSGNRDFARLLPRAIATALMREWSSSITVVKERGGEGERVEVVRMKGVLREEGRR